MEQCRWCYEGEYREVVRPFSAEERRNRFGGPPRGSIGKLGLSETGAEWRVLRCPKCGHLEWFQNVPAD